MHLRMGRPYASGLQSFDPSVAKASRPLAGEKLLLGVENFQSQAGYLHSTALLLLEFNLSVKRKRLPEGFPPFKRSASANH